MSQKYPGGLITKSPITPSGPYETSTASGIWTLDQQAYWRKLNQWPIAGSVEPDPQFNYVTMLLHGDGTNGAQNNTFLDSSTNNFTITRNGNTTQGSFSPYGSNWANYFNGTTDYLNLASTSNLDFGTGDFTVEAWINYADNTNYYTAVGTGNYTTTATNMYVLRQTNSGQIQFFYGNAASQNFLTGTTTIVANTWNHIAVSRSGTTMRIFLNGVLENTVTSSMDFTSPYGTYIGADNEGTYGIVSFAKGYISNVRIVKGTAVYTSTFTPSTTPLTAISGTQLLTCQSNRFIDNSASPKTITVNGNTSVQRFNPFGTSTAYSTSVIGGSGYFDGTGDYLQTPTNAAFTFGTGDFQIECWLYPLVTPDNFDFVMNGNGSDAVFWACRGSNLDFTNNDDTAGALSTTYPTLNAWTHLAVVRSGTTVSLYKNGVRQATATSSFNWSQTNFTFMAPNAGTSVFTNGYMSDARILKGATTYNPSSTTITVPTAPLTTVSGTSVLLNMTNGAIFDNAMMANQETVGSAQISTSVKKFGTGSLAFDGDGDWLKAPNSPNFDMGSGNFTIEGWFYQLGTGGQICAKYEAGNQASWAIGFDGSNWDVYTYYSTSSNLAIYTGVAGPTLNTWNHFALERNGANIEFYLNGSRVAQVAAQTMRTTTSAVAVGNLGQGYSSFFNGYIDDLRITKGYARYSGTTYTVPTQAFSNIGPT